jgi:hypothetical protein
MLRKLLLLIALLMVAACSKIGVPGGAAVPTTGDTATDVSAAGQFIPQLNGYVNVDGGNISSALSTVSGGASVLTGNPIAAAMIQQIDGMITCYQKVGAVAARVYVEANINNAVQGQVPSMGVLAVVNENRVANNFLPCALGSGNGFSAQDAQQPQPCTGSGSFVVNNETLLYVYAASKQELCTLMIQKIPHR